MANYTKTSGVSVIDLVSVPYPSLKVGDEITIPSTLAISMDMFVGRVGVTADTNPGTFHIQKNMNAAGGDGWTNVLSFTPVADTAATKTLNATANSGQKVITVDLTTGFSVGDKVYIEDTGAISNGEFHVIDSIDTDVSITLVDNLKATKDDADIIWSAADWLGASNIDLIAIKRLRVIYDNNGATAVDVHIKVVATTGDSIG